MNVIVCCEESQRVCLAFLSKGHNAFSCDLQNCSGGRPDRHIKGDAISILNGGNFITCDNKDHFVTKWDLLIAHPPCTFLTATGSQHMYPHGRIDVYRWQQAMEAKKFFLEFYNAPIDKICVENPVPITYIGLPPYTQIIHPCYFGSLYKKRTCLWLKNLQPLKRTHFDIDGISRSKAAWFNNCKDKHLARSKTFIEVANAMAEQWG